MGKTQIINRRPLKDVLWEAQRGRCWICAGRMRFYGGRQPEGATLDHVWPKGRYGQIGDVGVTLLAHRRCNELRGSPIPDEQSVRALVTVWRKVDRNWLSANLEMMEAGLRSFDLQRGRVEILRMFAEAA